MRVRPSCRRARISDSGVVRLDAPALARLVVARTRIDPARAFGRVFLFPERRLGFQVIHQELAGLEALVTVRGSDGHHHDLLAGLQRPDAMDHARAEDVEAPLRLIDHGFDRLLCHAGVVLELHHGHLRTAHRADEAADRAHALVASAQVSAFLRQVEVFVLDRHPRVHRQPPVTGGKNATSQPSSNAAVSSPMTCRTATRTALPRASACAYGPPRAISSSRSAPLVRAAVCTVSPPCPIASRTEAKYFTVTFMRAAPRAAGTTPPRRAQWCGRAGCPRARRPRRWT